MLAEMMDAVVRSKGRTRFARVPIQRHTVDSSRAGGDAWVRIRVLMVGICRTDLYAADGSLVVAEGRVLGHELVGEVDEDVGLWRRGQRVVVNPLVPCQNCVGCHAGARCSRACMLGIAVAAPSLTILRSMYSAFIMWGEVSR